MEINVQNFFKKQQCFISKRFYPSFKKMIETGDETDYKKYLEWRKFKNINQLIIDRKKLIEKMKNDIVVDPIVVDGDIIVDGNHRLIIAEVLGWKTLQAVEGKLKEKKFEKINEIRGKCYQHIHKEKHYPTWRGIVMEKFPSDLLLYQEIIYETKPEIIIEIGTKYGGSASFLQDMLDLYTHDGCVLTVDIIPQVKEKDSRIIYLIGDSISSNIQEKIISEAINKKTMLILDGDHSEERVTKELFHYSHLVSSGCFLVLEDCYVKNGIEYGPLFARDKFLKNNTEFIQTNLDKRFYCGMNLGGWLRKV